MSSRTTKKSKKRFRAGGMRMEGWVIEKWEANVGIALNEKLGGSCREEPFDGGLFDGSIEATQCV